MAEWTEGEAFGVRYRYRDDGGEGAHPLSRLTLEYWHDVRREWRTVKRTNSRDWFAIGLDAGKRLGAQTDLFASEAA